MISVVLDSNVIISGLIFTGPPRKILRSIINGDISLLISDEIISEVSGVLKGKKFNYPAKITAAIMQELEGISRMVYVRKRLKIITKDPDDNKILECALESNADLIISGDIHLLELGEFNNIPIVKPVDFLKVLDKQEK